MTMRRVTVLCALLCLTDALELLMVELLFPLSMVFQDQLLVYIADSNEDSYRQALQYYDLRSARFFCFFLFFFIYYFFFFPAC